MTAPVAWPVAVRPEWVDHYGHMNLAYYLVVFDAATDRLWPSLRLGADFRDQGLGTFAAESWVGYRREVREGQRLEVSAGVVGCDAKRLVCRHEMRLVDDGAVVAQAEFLFLCVDLAARRVVAWPAPVREQLTRAVAPTLRAFSNFASRLRTEPDRL